LFGGASIRPQQYDYRKAEDKKNDEPSELLTYRG